MNIEVPTSWNEVTLKQFDKILEISNNKDLTIAEREIRLIAALTDTDISVIQYLDAPSFQNISNKLSFLNTKPEKKVPVDSFILNGKDYHADLTPVNWTAGQFLDYKVIAGEDIDKKAARLIACFVYPLGAAYNDGSYDVEDVVNDINEYMTVSEVTGFTDFFMLQYTAFAKAILAYLKRKVKRWKGTSKQEKKEIIESLNRSEDLINVFGMLG